MHPRLRHLLLATTALLALGLTQAAAGPEGASVVGGAATIQGQGGPAVIVNQSTSSAVINWNTFNIRANESVRFNQPSASSVALNRVVGGLGPSEIMGSLTANGRVFIINRDGILFGPGSVVNTAGFLATTNDIKNADFMAGRYNFNIPGRPDASIVNQGRITATSGGFAALVAPGVRNSGTITATLGTVALASGNSFTLDMYGDKLITLAVGDSIANKVIDVATGRPLKSLVSNTKSGVISANGGRVELTAAAARAVVDSVINTKGVIRADSIGRHNGMIVLNAATGGSKPAGAPAQTIKLAGTISAAGTHRGTTGGTILVSGEHIKLANAKVDASGRRGGGKVLIGGDWGGGHPDLSLVNNASAKLENYTIATATTVSVDAKTTINASATGRGHGGKVVLWSDSETTFAGTILAKGGAKSGDGGFVETSSHGLLNYRGMTDTRAPNGATGTLLLDPFDVRISNRETTDGSINGGIFSPTGNESNLNANELAAALQTSNIIVTTGGAGSPGSQTGDITIGSGTHLNWIASTTLTLSAFHDIVFEPGSSISNGTNSNPSAGNLILRADNSGTGSGTVIFPQAASGDVDFSKSTGTVSIYYNPPGEPQTKYQNPTIFACADPCSGHVVVQQLSQVTAYMLVNTANDLQAITTSTSRPNAYALGRDINASSIANFTPIGNGTSAFNTIFDGQGFTISNLTVAPSDSTTTNIGLFESIGPTGIVRNLNLSDVKISANPSVPSQSVGTLAGANAGQIINVSVGGPNSQVSGFVNGVGITGVGAGGLVGQNSGLIANSSSAATVSVGDSNSTTASNTAGGLVATNLGTITGSSASGNVSGGAFSTVGGLVGQNFFNLGAGSITSSFASGSVTVGDSSVAGGLAGTSNGTIVASSAIGAVTGGGNSVLGGFIGTLSFQNGPGEITNSSAQGAVTSTGPNSVVGGFVGLTSGTISSSAASGPVSGTSSSYLGGFVGTNLGLIEQSTAIGSVTGSGGNNIVGGFVGANFGSIDGSSASGNAASGADSAVGGFAGSNAQFVNFQPGSIPGSSFPVGTITNSSASGTASGGAGSAVDPFIALNNPNSSSNLPAFPSIVAGCTDPTCVFVNTGVLPSAPFPPFPPSPPSSDRLLASLLLLSPELRASLLAQQAQVILNLTSTIQLAALSTAPVVNTTQGGIRLPPQQAPGTGTGPAAGNPFLPPGIDQRIIDIPPPNETRLKTDEVMVQIRTDIGVERLRAAVANLGVSILATEDLTILGSTAVRLHIDDGRTPAEVIRALAAVQMVAVAQPQYVYNLDQAAGAPTPSSSRSEGQPGDAAQYILQKLSLADVHRMVRGANVPIAVIDSEIDAAHPDLEGAVTQRYDAVGALDKPHPHGTGMAGAMAARQRLLGTAPAARLLAVHAFSTSVATPESTTFNILKGINWAVGQGARVINMSFAGPKDPSLERALKLAYEKGIVLIAAAGNAGAKSPPLFPGADPLVIAVTATDVDDKLFTGANRGKYISVAAPGVDILVPAPENSYQITTGTSVAAAEVSGIVALLLERNPKLTPADIRRILTASARRLGTGERDDNFGAGLIDPLKALQLAEPRTAATTPPPAPTPTLRQR